MTPETDHILVSVAIEERMSRLEDKLDRVLALASTSEQHIGVIRAHIGPVVETLQKSPLFRMLGGK